MRLFSNEISRRSMGTLLGGAASSAFILATPWVAHAQTSPAAAQSSSAPAQTSSQTIGEIVVTAQRRQERLQDVPISMAALTPQAIANQQISDISDLRGKVAGLSITTWSTSSASNLVSIRGISGQPLPIGASQATAIYLDGVYLSRPDAAFFGLDDVARIEVLRGPQGTLYGRNATAGAINIITRDPTKTLTGGITGSYGNYNSYDARGSVTGPLFGNFTFGLSAAVNGHGDYYTNVFSGKKVGDLRGVTGRAKLRYDNDAGTFDATLSVDSSETTGPGYYKSVVDATGAYIGLVNPKLVTSRISDDLFEHDVRSSGVGLVSNYKIASNLVLTSITSWRHQLSGTVWDSSGGQNPPQFAVIYDGSDAFNQELRAVYTGSRFNVTFGGNYFNERATLAYSAVTPPRPVGHQAPYDDSFDEALAAFVQADYKFTDRLTATAGVRYNYEHRAFIVDYRYNYPNPAGVGFGTLYDSAVLPAFGINYKPTSDTMVYGKVSEGYQAPGFNFLPGAPNPAINPVTHQPNPPRMNPFASEKMWAYEVGLKSQWLEHRLTANIDGFYYDYLNIGVRNVTAPGVTTISNAGPASVKGVEGELTWKVADGLSLSARATYAKSEYKSFCQPVSAGTPVGSDTTCTAVINGNSLPGADRSHNRLNNSPEWSGGVGLDYSRPIKDMQLKANLTYSFESRVYFSAVNEIAVSDADGWRRLDARIGLELPNHVELFAYGRNLTNDRYFGYIARTSATFVNGTLNDPETYGVGVKYRF